MIIRDGYKLVFKIIYRFPIYRSYVGGPGAVCYKINKWTKPMRGCGPLAVFDNFENAELFCDSEVNLYDAEGANLLIFKCKYVPSEKKSLWFRYMMEVKESFAGSFPEGTVLADQVMITNMEV
jgi:hypothetical protein